MQKLSVLQAGVISAVYTLGSRAGSFGTEFPVGSSRVAFCDSPALTSWLGLATNGSSFLRARLEPDRVGSRPALPPTPPTPPSPSPSPTPPPPPLPGARPPIQSDDPTYLDEFLATAWSKLMLFDWRKGCLIGFGVLSIYLLWRYSRVRNPGGDEDERHRPNPGAGFQTRGLADALLPHGDEDTILLPQRHVLLTELPTTIEFAGPVKVGEAVFGPYPWERFHILILPAKPTIVFLVPMLSNRDAGGADIMAPPHTWTPNVINSNPSDEELSLNEGFTSYAERRIVKVLKGEEWAAFDMELGWRGLNRTLDILKNNTELQGEMAGIDPDDVLLWHIKNLIGRPAIDNFLKKYIATFKFQTTDKETFLQFLKANVSGIETQVNLNLLLESTSTSPDAVKTDSDSYRKVQSLAAEFKYGKIPTAEDVADWGGEEWELYLENVSTDESSQLAQVTALDERYKLSKSRYYEVKVAFLQLAIPTGCRCYFNGTDKWLKLVGRMKYLRLNRQGPNNT